LDPHSPLAWIINQGRSLAPPKRDKKCWKRQWRKMLDINCVWLDKWKTCIMMIMILTIIFMILVNDHNEYIYIHVVRTNIYIYIHTYIS
jgi:maltodextrin utilization protein YvdJ